MINEEVDRERPTFERETFRARINDCPRSLKMQGEIKRSYGKPSFYYSKWGNTNIEEEQVWRKRSALFQKAAHATKLTSRLRWRSSSNETDKKKEGHQFAGFDDGGGGQTGESEKEPWHIQA